MFEKEAEEYFETECLHSYADTEEQLKEDVVTAFQKGAEFGYNKANEWHYVKDGDLPKDNKDMLISEQLILIIKMKGSDCLSLALGRYNFSTQEFGYQHIVGLTDVIAWKEIVPPNI